MQSKQLIIKSVQIGYYVNDIKKGQPELIFLHGWGSNSTLWFKAFTSEFLSQNNLYCIDLPGFGISETPDYDLDVSNYGEFVQEFIQKLNLSEVILIGHSLGGRITIKIAANDCKNISKIVLVNAAGVYHTSNSTKLITKISKIVKPLFKAGFMQGIRRAIYKILKAEDYLNNSKLQKTFIKVIQEDLTQYLSKITLPALIIWGKDDDNEYTPVSDGAKMHQLITNSQFVIIEGAKHYSFLDKPEEFLKALINFTNT